MQQAESNHRWRIVYPPFAPMRYTPVISLSWIYKRGSAILILFALAAAVALTYFWIPVPAPITYERIASISKDYVERTAIAKRLLWGSARAVSGGEHSLQSADATADDVPDLLKESGEHSELYAFVTPMGQTLPPSADASPHAQDSINATSVRMTLEAGPQTLPPDRSIQPAIGMQEDSISIVDTATSTGSILEEPASSSSIVATATALNEASASGRASGILSDYWPFTSQDGLQMHSRHLQDHTHPSNPSYTERALGSQLPQFTRPDFCADCVDIVIPYVNGSDPWFLDQQRRFEGELHQQTGQTWHRHDASGKHRFSDHDELLYSLRSIVRFAPWIRYIHILTNGDQRPVWLRNFDGEISSDRVTSDPTTSTNLNSTGRLPKVRLVPHTLLFTNASHVPTFSIYAVKMHLHRIPGLAPHFIYMEVCAWCVPLLIACAASCPDALFKCCNVCRLRDQSI